MRLRRLGIAAIVLLALTMGLGACRDDTSSTGGGAKSPPPPNSSAALPTGPPPAAIGIAGKWVGAYTTAQTAGGQGTFNMTFTVAGTKITGPIHIDGSPCVKDGTVTGIVSGTKISFGAVKASQTIMFTGALSGGKLSGTYDAPRCGPGTKGTWTASRA